MTNLFASRHFVTVHLKKKKINTVTWEELEVFREKHAQKLHWEAAAPTYVIGPNGGTGEVLEIMDNFSESLHIWKRTAKKLRNALNLTFAIVISSFTVTKHQFEHVHSERFFCLFGIFFFNDNWKVSWKH